MKKKALSLLLTLALCLSLLPTAAWATEDEGESSPAAQSGETHTDHPVCGNLGSDCPDPGHSGHTNLTGWIAISDEAGLNAVQENGHYYLTREVEISRTWEPKDGVVLCLNGNTLQANGDFDAIEVGRDVTFTLTDCEDTGKVTHTNGNGRGVYNYAGIFKMYGGSITDNVATSSGGGGVYNYSIPNPFASTTTKAYFYMYGGSISKNKAASGGGIYNLGGNVYMYGGSVTGNEAESSGGGVYTVTCGESNSPYFEMSGTASITNNKAVTGSGVYSYSGGYGSGGRFSMSDNAAITSNTATNSGAVYMESGTLYTYNSAKITDNTKDDGTASNVYLEDSVVIYARSSFSGKVGLTAEKAGTNSIVVVRAASGATLSERDKEKFPSDDDRYEVRYSNGLLVLAVKPHAHDLCGTTHHDVGGHTEESVTFTPWISDSALPVSGTYYLTKDVTLTSTHIVTGSLTLCLNGHTITGKNISNASGIIQVNTDNGNFTLTDCENDGNKGTITMPANESKNKYGVYVTGGKFALYNGTISVAGPSCVGVSLNRSTFTMNGGTISNPTDASVNDVDGVYVGYEGKFFMNGGTISNNQRYGVNVTGSSQGSGQGEVTMTGGTITGNGNSGVRVINGNTLTVSGSPIITGNNGVNVDLSDGKIIVAGNLGDSAKIGVTAQNAADGTLIAKPATGVTLTNNDAAKFSSDNTNYSVVLSNDGNLVLGEGSTPQPSEHTDHYLCNGSSCTHLGGHTENAKTTFTAWNETDSLPTSGAYYLTKDVTLSGTHTVTGKLTICLNGHKILCNAGDTAKNYTATIAVNSGATFNLTDCHTGTKAGQITHVTGKYGNGVYNHGTFNMYGGSITGNNGHGVMNYTSDGASTAIFNMYGGTLTNNNDSYGGGLENDCYSNTNPSIANLYGGSITNNKGGYRGGGIANSGGSIVNMNDGFVIAGNEVTDRGGGVYNCMSTFNMNGGIIGGTSADDANKADNDYSYGGAGGGVANWGGTFNMNGGTIIGNSSKESGGGVSNSPYFNDVKATFNMTGGKITGNKAQYGGGVSSIGSAAYDGKPAITSDFSVGGTASITGNEAKNGGGVYLGDSTMDVFGSVNITNNKNNGTNSNVYLTDGKTMTVDNDFDGKIGVTAEKPVEELVVATGTSLTGNVVTKFQSDDVKYGIKLSGNDLVLTGKTDVTNKITFPSGQLTYTGSGLRYEKATISEGYNGKFTYTYWVPKGGSTGELDANGLPLAVGTYTVIATYEDDDNYGTARAILEVVAGSNNNNSSSSGGGGGGRTSYPVNAPSKSDNGTVTTSPKNATSGSTVTITVKPDKGYVLDTITVIDSKGNTVKLTDKGDGKFSFVMPSGQVDVKATFTKAAEEETSPFDDVARSDYYYDAVKWAAEQGITGGTGSGKFSPADACTRAQIVTFLWRTAGSPAPKGMSSFTDVPADAYYAKAVAWAVENGITAGTSADKFSPDATCTRAHAVTFLFRLAKGSATDAPGFLDVAADAYYAQPVKWAVDNGITSGIGNGLFGPDNRCTRAQIVTFLYQADKI